MHYGPDLAAIHDSAFAFTAESGADVLVGAVRRAFPDGGLVVDLGCGSGILSRALTDAGYDVLGVDISPAMVRLARARAPKATFRAGSILDVDIPSCVAVAAVGEIVNYAGARPAKGKRGGLSALARLFRRLHAALEPGGVFLFDSAGPGRGGPEGRREIFRDDEDWSMHVVIEERGRTLTRDMAIFRKAGKAYRRTDEHHDLALYRPDDVEARLRAAGFAVRRLRRYAELRLPAGLTGFLATKRG
ncbi:MAG TPA: class I SAM-dependent methyltransferase [Acidimicrobiia bacterium]|nr:class I SAM-dependent methyltransferase [Acidimicrobiia bacterium]